MRVRSVARRAAVARSVTSIRSGASTTSSAVTSTGRGRPRSRSSVADHAACTKAGSIRARSYQPRERMGTATARMPDPSERARWLRRTCVVSSVGTSTPPTGRSTSWLSVTADGRRVPWESRRSRSTTSRPIVEACATRPGHQTRTGTALVRTSDGGRGTTSSGSSSAPSRPMPHSSAPPIGRCSVHPAPGCAAWSGGQGEQPRRAAQHLDRVVAERGGAGVQPQGAREPALRQGSGVGAGGLRQLVPRQVRGSRAVDHDAVVGGLEVHVVQDADGQHGPAQAHVPPAPGAGVVVIPSPYGRRGGRSRPRGRGDPDG